MQKKKNCRNRQKKKNKKENKKKAYYLVDQKFHSKDFSIDVGKLINYGQSNTQGARQEK